MATGNACYTKYNGTTYHAHTSNSLCAKLELKMREDGVDDMVFQFTSSVDESVKGIYWYKEESGEGVWRRFYPSHWVRTSFRRGRETPHHKKEGY